jgi:hypothetical protein
MLLIMLEPMFSTDYLNGPPRGPLSLDAIILSNPAAKNFPSMTSERLGKADALLKEASQRLEKYRHAIGSANYVMAQGWLEM